MDDLTTRLQKQAERGTYIPDGPELMRDVITELAALSCKNSQLLSTNYDLHKERDRQIDEIEFLRSRLAAHEYIPTPEERRKQEALAKEIAAEVIADETELKRLRLEIESLRSRLAEAEAREARAVCLRCGSPMGVVGGVPTTNTDLYDSGRINADSASVEGEK